MFLFVCYFPTTEPTFSATLDLNPPSAFADVMYRGTLGGKDRPANGRALFLLFFFSGGDLVPSVARHHMMRRVARLARDSVKVLSAVIVVVVVVYSFGNFEGSLHMMGRLHLRGCYHI